eukprot:754927-Hanusia_phi.AAC.2
MDEKDSNSIPDGNVGALNCEINASCPRNEPFSVQVSEEEGRTPAILPEDFCHPNADSLKCVEENNVNDPRVKPGSHDPVSLVDKEDGQQQGSKCQILVETKAEDIAEVQNEDVSEEKHGNSEPPESNRALETENCVKDLDGNGKVNAHVPPASANFSNSMQEQKRSDCSIIPMDRSDSTESISVGTSQDGTTKTVSSDQSSKSMEDDTSCSHGELERGVHGAPGRMEDQHVGIAIGAKVLNSTPPNTGPQAGEAPLKDSILTQQDIEVQAEAPNGVQIPHTTKELLCQTVQGMQDNLKVVEDKAKGVHGSQAHQCPINEMPNQPEVMEESGPHQPKSISSTEQSATRVLKHIQSPTKDGVGWQEEVQESQQHAMIEDKNPQQTEKQQNPANILEAEANSVKQPSVQT